MATKPLQVARQGRLNWRQVGILYQREMRLAFREKNIVINSILIPIFLYPFLLWIVFTVMTFVSGQTEGLRSRLVIKDWPAGHPALRRSLERNEQFELLDLKASAADLQKKVRFGELDAVVAFRPPDEAAAALSGNFQARIVFDQSKERSVAARDRVKREIDFYRAAWLKRSAHARGIDDSRWQGFTLTSTNVASGKQMGSFLLGLMLPVIFVVMVAVGCFYPAVDSLAGERERNTWETLMSTAASRTSIVAAKYLYIATLGCLAGTLNLLAVVLTLKPILAPLLERAGKTFDSSLPLGAIPLLALSAILLAGFVAAGMMIFASFARSFREGQAMITPFYMLIMIPVVFLQVPGLDLTLPLACLPIFNVTLMVREAVSGTFHWPQIGVTVAVSVFVIALCIRLVAFILQFEDVLVGSYNGSFTRFLRERILGKAKREQPLGEATT